MQNNNGGVMKANKKFAGQLCNICKREIEFGETIHICPDCQSINHETCWQNEGGCNSFSCNSVQKFSNKSNNNQFNKSSSNQSNDLQLDDFELNDFSQNSLQKAPRSYSGQGSMQNASRTFAGQSSMQNAQRRFSGQGSLQNRPNNFSNASPANMVACRWCKEPIVRGTRKCPHCGEMQSDADRNRAKALVEDVPDEDKNIPGGFWGLIILMPDIAFIAGIIYIFRGKHICGLKIMGASFVCFVIRILLYIVTHN
ncbi:MAG: hypothetical protein J6Z11_08975 [Candidatus Riflebacteria bacterium]|nr:hypothetical protein [Candidatus Riflebacteria bacterium]